MCRYAFIVVSAGAVAAAAAAATVAVSADFQLETGPLIRAIQSNYLCRYQLLKAAEGCAIFFSATSLDLCWASLMRAHVAARRSWQTSTPGSVCLPTAQHWLRASLVCDQIINLKKGAN